MLASGKDVFTPKKDMKYEQINLFALGKKKFKIEKPIRLIELFAGIGSQAMALRDLGADFEHYKVVEFEKYAIKSYNAIHGTDFEPKGRRIYTFAEPLF